MSEEAEDIGKKCICWQCIGEPFLKAEVKNGKDVVRCDYCDAETFGISIDEIADRVDVAKDEHYRRTSDEPSAFQYSMMKEGDYDWEREGDPVIDVIGNMCLIEEEPALDIQQVLSDRTYDMEDAKMGVEGPYEDETHYASKDADDLDLREQWRNLEESLKKETRFFSKEAETILDHVFEGLNSHKNVRGKSVIVNVGPGKKIDALYRGRIFQSSEGLERALKNPELEIGPPPYRYAISGRMNPHGIAMFYGATNAKTVLSEVRPAVGCNVLIGRFDILRPLRLLDVAALKSILVQGSVFDPTYLQRIERARFLQRLSDRISVPVTPDHQPLDYLITQVIADYLTNRVDPSIDGIMYPSAQSGTKGVNIVLFHKAALVKQKDAGIDNLEISMYAMNPEDDEPEYIVWENVQNEEDAVVPGTQKEDGPPISFFEGSSVQLGFSDYRDITLELDHKTLVVHKATSVKVTTLPTPVKRYQVKHQKKPDF